MRRLSRRSASREGGPHIGTSLHSRPRPFRSVNNREQFAADLVHGGPERAYGLPLARRCWRILGSITPSVMPTRALDTLEQAWLQAKDATDPRGRAVADFALGEWASVAVHAGELDAADRRLREVASRGVAGTAGVKLAQARERLDLIRRERERLVPYGVEYTRRAAHAARGGPVPGVDGASSGGMGHDAQRRPDTRTARRSAAIDHRTDDGDGDPRALDSPPADPALRGHRRAPA